MGGCTSNHTSFQRWTALKSSKTGRAVVPPETSKAVEWRSKELPLLHKAWCSTASTTLTFHPPPPPKKTKQDATRNTTMQQRVGSTPPPPQASRTQPATQQCSKEQAAQTWLQLHVLSADFWTQMLSQSTRWKGVACVQSPPPTFGCWLGAASILYVGKGMIMHMFARLKSLLRPR